MTRPLAAGGLALLALAALPAPAAAQTWGQPTYVTPSGRPVGGTPLSEVETRAYAETGRWAAGYGPPVRVWVPAPGQAHPGPAYGYRYDDGHSYAYRTPRRAPRPHPGYRDAWGYDDDRPPSARWAANRPHHRREGCGCQDVYLYDR
jgi:hypothetical protein